VKAAAKPLSRFAPCRAVGRRRWFPRVTRHVAGWGTAGNFGERIINVGMVRPGM
jgi:hypothetical protein